MKRKENIIIIFMLLFGLFSQSVNAINDSNPEITDELNDVFGPLIEHPNLFNILKVLSIIDMDTFDFMDIESADIYEDENEPQYLFASLKIKDFDYSNVRTIYAIRWTFNDKHYFVCCHTYSNGDFKWFSAGRTFGLFDNWAYKNGLIQDISNCEFDELNNLISFKIPKDIIGNPESGDVLSYTNAWTGLRFIFEILTYPFGGEMAIDQTPFGEDYIIKY
jgi:hypothetical protein